MLKVGLTGGIGSGKTTVAQAFSSIGVPVYNCDLAARRLMESDERIVSGLKRQFGDDIYGSDGLLDRKALAGIIFRDAQTLEFVNGLVHPIVASDFLLWADNLAEAGKSWVLCEAAIMVESGMDKLMDKIIVVSLPREMRVERAMLRDNASREQIERRINNQSADDKLIDRADFIISPDDKHLIFPQILDIDRQLSCK